MIPKEVVECMICGDPFEENAEDYDEEYLRICPHCAID